jgi:hypothetical protein
MHILLACKSMLFPSVVRSNNGHTRLALFLRMVVRVPKYGRYSRLMLRSRYMTMDGYSTPRFVRVIVAFHTFVVEIAI